MYETARHIVSRLHAARDIWGHQLSLLFTESLENCPFCRKPPRVHASHLKEQHLFLIASSSESPEFL